MTSHSVHIHMETISGHFLLKCWFIPAASLVPPLFKRKQINKATCCLANAIKFKTLVIKDILIQSCSLAFPFALSKGMVNPNMLHVRVVQPSAYWMLSVSRSNSLQKDMKYSLHYETVYITSAQIMLSTKKYFIKSIFRFMLPSESKYLEKCKYQN